MNLNFVLQKLINLQILQSEAIQGTLETLSQSDQILQVDPLMLLCIQDSWLVTLA